MAIARLKAQLHKQKTQEQLIISARQKEEKLSQDVSLLKEELLQATRGHTPVSVYKWCTKLLQCCKVYILQ